MKVDEGTKHEEEPGVMRKPAAAAKRPSTESNAGRVDFNIFSRLFRVWVHLPCLIPSGLDSKDRKISGISYYKQDGVFAVKVNGVQVIKARGGGGHFFKCPCS